MPRDRYEPLKLNQTNQYAGYQFYAQVRVDGMEPVDGFIYLILSVYHWIRNRVPEDDRNVPGLALPEAEEYNSVSAESFLPYHFSVGYTMDITPLVEDGIWSLRLKEPDIGTAERPPVSGRFFTTRVGLRLNEKGYTELGIRIDVTDPASEEKEVDFAFRPGFVRSLAIQPAICFEQVRELGYGCPLRVDTPEEYKKFLYMLDNEENQLPLAVFTHYKPVEKYPAPVSMEEFVKNDVMKSLLQSPVMGFGIPEKKDIPMPLMSSVSGMPPLRSGVVKTEIRVKSPIPAADAPVAASPSVPVADPVLLHDADSFARSAFGYALTVVLGDSFFEKFASRIRKDIQPGDIVLCGARKFRNAVTVVGFSGEKEKDRKKAYDEALFCAQSYSKHKAPYSFGSVVFEAEARNLAQQKELDRILESEHLEEKERYEQLVRFAEGQKTVISEKDEKISRLEKQRDEEFDRGVAYGDSENAKLEEENNNLRKDLAAEQEKYRQMLSEHQWAKNVLGALDQMRKVEKLPSCNEDVVSYFIQVYPDRIGFTENGKWEASRCGLKTDHLWEILYMVSNDLVDLFREKGENLTEEDVTRAAGCEMSFREGAMTRKDKDMMKLREDEYEGKAISVEPHLKLKSVKGEPSHQRLHFCYDPELKKIIIGHLGEHLESAATQYSGQR